MAKLNSRYPGLRSFQAHERDLFFGRNEEIRDLYQLIKVSRLSVLFAKSGIGKSSILNAGVIPLLKEGNYRIFSSRFQDTKSSPAEILIQQMEYYAQKVQLAAKAASRIQEFEQLSGRKAGLWEQFRAYNFEEELGITPVLIFDQFEELFLHSNAEQEEFANFLSDLVYERIPKALQETKAELSLSDDDIFDDLFEEDFGDYQLDEGYKDDGLDWWRRPLNYKVVMAIRSDKLSLMDRLSDSIPAILDYRYELKALNRKAATAAIIQPAQLSGAQFSSPTFKYEQAALAQILDNLSNEKGEIESFQLQIICGHLEELVQKEKLKQIEAQHIGGASGIQQILNNYYELKIQSLGTVADQLLARKLIEENMIVDGIRVSLAEPIVLKTIPQALLEKLLATRIIKPENTHLGNAYEVSHDTLVEPILKSYENRRQKEEAAAAEAERLRLEKEAQAQRQEVALAQKRRRQALMVAAVAVVMAVLALIAVFWAISAQMDAVWQKNKAFEAASEAKQQETEAIENYNKAIFSDIQRLEDELRSFKNAGKAGKAPAEQKLQQIQDKLNELKDTESQADQIQAIKKKFQWSE